MCYKIESRLISENNDALGATSIKSNLVIPAYTNNGCGLYTSLVLEAKKSIKTKVTTYGVIAHSLEKLLLRNIEILISLKSSFIALKNFQYILTSNDEGYRVRDVRSASLPICLTLLNILRELSSKNQIHSIVGTGVLRMDGSFDSCAFENIKEKALNQEFSNNKQFINSEICGHVFDLEALLTSCN